MAIHTFGYLQTRLTRRRLAEVCRVKARRRVSPRNLRLEIVRLKNFETIPGRVGGLTFSSWARSIYQERGDARIASLARETWHEIPQLNENVSLSSDNTNSDQSGGIVWPYGVPGPYTLPILPRGLGSPGLLFPRWNPPLFTLSLFLRVSVLLSTTSISVSRTKPISCVRELDDVTAKLLEKTLAILLRTCLGRFCIDIVC